MPKVWENRVRINWAAVRELKLSYHNGIHIIYMVTPPTPPRSILKGLALHLLANKYIITSARTAEHAVADSVLLIF